MFYVTWGWDRVTEAGRGEAGAGSATGRAERKGEETGGRTVHETQEAGTQRMEMAGGAMGWEP